MMKHDVKNEMIKMSGNGMSWFASFIACLMAVFFFLQSFKFNKLIIKQTG